MAPHQASERLKVNNSNTVRCVGTFGGTVGGYWMRSTMLDFLTLQAKLRQARSGPTTRVSWTVLQLSSLR